MALALVVDGTKSHDGRRTGNGQAEPSPLPAARSRRFAAAPPRKIPGGFSVAASPARRVGSRAAREPRSSASASLRRQRSVFGLRIFRLRLARPPGAQAREAEGSGVTPEQDQAEHGEEPGLRGVLVVHPVIAEQQDLTCTARDQHHWPEGPSGLGQRRGQDEHRVVVTSQVRHAHDERGGEGLSDPERLGAPQGPGRPQEQAGDDRQVDRLALLVAIDAPLLPALEGVVEVVVAREAHATFPGVDQHGLEAHVVGERRVVVGLERV